MSAVDPAGCCRRREVVCGDAGTLTRLRAGTVHIEMSTVNVTRKGQIRDAVRRRA